MFLSTNLKVGENRLLLRMCGSTTVPFGWIKNSPSNLKIALKTLWKWRETISPDRWKKNDTLRFFTLCPIMCRNFATCSSTVDRYESLTSPVPHIRSHNLMKAFGPMRIMWRDCSVWTKYSINSCLRRSFCGWDSLIQLLVVGTVRNNISIQKQSYKESWLMHLHYLFFICSSICEIKFMFAATRSS